MKSIFTKENLKKSVEDLVESIFEFCKSEVVRINKLSESSRRDAKSIIIYRLKNLPIWNNMGIISLRHAHDHIYDKWSVEWWLENLVNDLVATRKVNKTVSEYVAFKGEYPDPIPAYEIERDGAHLVIDLKSIPKDNKFILIEYTEVYFTYKKFVHNILEDIDNIGVLDSDHNFCLLFYLMRNHEELIRTHAGKISDALQVMKEKENIEHEQIDCINTNLIKLNRPVNVDFMKKNGFFSEYTDKDKFKLVSDELGKTYSKISNYYLFDKKPDNITIGIKRGVEIHIYISPHIVYTDILDIKCFN